MDVDRKTPSGQGNTYFTPPRGHLPLRWAGSMISTMSFTSTFWFCWSIRVTLRSSETDKNLSSFVGLRFLWFSKMGRSQPIAALNLFNVDTFSANRMIGVQDWSAQLLPSGRERFRDRQRLFRYFFGCWPQNHLCFRVRDDAGIPLDASSAGLSSPGICRHFFCHRLIDDHGDAMSYKCMISVWCGVNPLKDWCLRINPISLRNILKIHFETDGDDETGRKIYI